MTAWSLVPALWWLVTAFLALWVYRACRRVWMSLRRVGRRG